MAVGSNPTSTSGKTFVLQSPEVNITKKICMSLTVYFVWEKDSPLSQTILQINSTSSDGQVEKLHEVRHISCIFNCSFRSMVFFSQFHQHVKYLKTCKGNVPHINLTCQKSYNSRTFL